MAETALSGLCADLAMFAYGVDAKFAHAGKGKDFSSGWRSAERGRAEGGMDGDRVGAVPVIDDAYALGRRPDFHARCRWRVAIERCGELFEISSEQMGGQGGKAQVRDDFRRARLHDHAARALVGNV